MKKDLTVENLMNTYANSDDTMDLEFQTADQTIFVRNVEVPEDIDEFYWFNEANVEKAVNEAEAEDIEGEQDISVEVRKTQWGFRPVVNGEEIVSINGEDPEAVKETAYDFLNEIYRQMEKDENHGLLFHACGFDGRAQTELRSEYKEIGVNVF